MDFIKNQIQKEKEKRKSSSDELLKAKPARLEIAIESPPLVSYGTIANSAGALMSGQLKIHVTDLPVKLEKYELELVARIKYAKPVSKDCPDCKVNTNELKKWSIITEPRAFEKGTHSTPFSYLLDGHLPATTDMPLGAVDYVLTAVAIAANGEKTTTSHTLELKRAILPPENDRTTVRVFPPTTLRAELMYPPVMYPTGEFQAHLCLSGVVWKAGTDVHRWRLQKVTWLLEECSKMVSRPCPKHAHKVGGEGKGLEHTSVKSIGSREIRNGWKSDYSVETGGSNTVELTCSIDSKAKPVCDMSNPTGMSVQHRLMLELVVGEEVVNWKQPSQWNASGNARLLRMVFTVIITERAGMGISWDEELPPVYEDVPSSPPGYEYNQMEDYDPAELGRLSPLAHEDPLPQQGESSHQGSSGDAAQSS